MKTTPFTDVHIALGAKMHEFAGFNMPIEYSGIIDEHMTVVNGVGVFDVSHMGEFWVKGPNALAFIQSVTSNDASVLPLGKAQYTCFPNDKGGIVDDLLVYRFSAEKYLLVVNAANIEKDWAWCTKWAKELGMNVDTDLENASDNICQLAVQGPLALKAMQKLTTANVVDMEYYTFQEIPFAGIDKVIFSTTGYTGAGGCEIYAYVKDAEKLWHAVFEAGAEFGIKPAGLGSRDTLRLEAGFCLYGHEIDDDHSPIEAGLGWITKFAEGKNFTNRAELERQKKEGVTRKLCAFELQEKGIPRHGYEIADAEGNVIGVVTSGTMSPVLKKGIGMGYVKPEFAKAGTDIFIKVRNKNLKAQVVKAPFRK